MTLKIIYTLQQRQLLLFMPRTLLARRYFGSKHVELGQHRRQQFSISCHLKTAIEDTKSHMLHGEESYADDSEKSVDKAELRRDITYVKSVVSKLQYFHCDKPESAAKPSSEELKNLLQEIKLVDREKLSSLSYGNHSLRNGCIALSNNSGEQESSQIYFNEVKSKLINSIIKKANMLEKKKTAIDMLHLLEMVSDVLLPAVQGMHEEVVVNLLNAFYNCAFSISRIQPQLDIWFRTLHSLLLLNSLFEISGDESGKFKSLQFKLGKRFMDACSNRHSMESLDQILIFSYLAGVLCTPLPQELYFKLTKVLQSNISTLQSDTDLLAVVCWAFFRCQQKCVSRLILMTALDKVRTDIQESNYAISPPSHLMLKELSYSMDKVVFKHYPHIQQKYFSTIKSIMPRLKSEDVATSVRIVHGIVRSRHVSSTIIQQFATKLLFMDFSQLRLKEIAMIIELLAEVNLVKSPELYNKLQKELELPDRAEERRKYSTSTVSALVGLSYIDRYPASLYSEVLNEETAEKVKKSAVVSSKLLWLDGCIELSGVPYDGPRLERLYKIHVTKYGSKPSTKRRDGSMTTQTSMLTRIADILTDSHIADLYDCEINQPMEHSLLQDVVLSSKTDLTKAVIVPWSENLYTRIFKPSEKKETGDVVLRVLSQHKTRLKHLQKLGYVTIPIPYLEYEMSKNREKLIENKLREAGLLKNGKSDA